MAKSLRTCCVRLYENSHGVDKNGYAAFEDDYASDYLVAKDDMEDLLELSRPPVRPAEVDGFIRGDKLTGKTKEVIRNYIENLEG